MKFQGHVTRDREAVERIKKDELCYTSGGKAKNCKAILAAMDAADKARPTWKAAVFVQQAGEDKLVMPAGTKQFTESLASGDKLYKEYPDAYHNLIMELPETKREVTEDMKKWILERV